MRNIHFLFLFKIISTLFLFSSLVWQSSCGNKSQQKPNIIFIMSDDHAFQAISAYDNKLIETPNIDRLANEGMRFNRAYVTNSICSPSRAVILTGKHSHLNGVRDNINVFDSAQQTFPKILQKSGYETAVIGKWHLKSEPSGFDYWRVLPDQGVYYQPKFRTPGGIVTEQGYVTEVITDLTLDWLNNLRDKDKPFMLMYQHKAPHRSWLPAQKYLDEFMDKPIPVPETLFDDYTGRGTAAKEAEMRIKEHMGLTNDNKIKTEIIDSLGIEEFYLWYAALYERNYNLMTSEEQKKWDTVYGPINDEFLNHPPEGDSLVLWKYRRYMEDYLASIKSVDDNVGRLLDFLEESGLDENTLVVYTSDQGFYLGEHGWFDKRFMYEESFRTPLLMRWPGKIKPASVNENLVQNLDFAQTLLDIAGAEIPGDMQGMSLSPLFEDNTKYWRDALYYHYYEYPGIHAVKRHYGISTARYKLIHFYHDIDEWELYDLEADPQELNNLIDDPKTRKIKTTLERKLKALRAQYGDSDDLTQQILESDLKN